MGTIPELDEACAINDRIASEKQSTLADEKDRRGLWLRAVAKGATRVQIQERCGVPKALLESELKKARSETDDPALAKIGTAKGGLTEGEYWCPETGCIRAVGDGNEPLQSAQALGMHRMAAHGYRLGERALTASVVRKARADLTTPTRELARKWKVSPHALGAARSGKTWKQLAR